MKKRLFTALVVLTGLFLMSASIVWAQAPAPVAKTGQTISYATGDDGDLRKGVAWPSPRFTDNEDGTVTDNLTGLMWAKNASQGLRTWDEALDYANNLILGTSCGQELTDWRLPNILELQSLTVLTNVDSALPTDHPFSPVPFYYYWSSTTSVNNTNFAWTVHMVDGAVNNKSYN